MEIYTFKAYYQLTKVHKFKYSELWSLSWFEVCTGDLKPFEVEATILVLLT